MNENKVLMLAPVNIGIEELKPFQVSQTSAGTFAKHCWSVWQKVAFLEA